MTDLSIHKVHQKPDIAGRMVHWADELSEFDIQYEARGTIKGQVYVDFMVELSSKDSQSNPNNFQWVLSVDGSSNQQGSGVEVIIEGPIWLLIKQALRFAFRASNNQVEYETLIVGMLLAKELGAQRLLVKSDSILVTRQVTGEYQVKDPQLAPFTSCMKMNPLRSCKSALQILGKHLISVILLMNYFLSSL